ncbi:hypothetical protein [Pseudoduganella namucuonensis]|uniref:Gel scht n=1 Tax=Pseudoduganella namucuonensis TaxID=1035707 RepID=A0A1I7JUG5_9BURK|nr:hypothetical protein [Pseudoduganella namucuonensis]SFU88830.1 hypothetical protein SAMN05216552_101324 [Pseudoduganella namucuonensis]
MGVIASGGCAAAMLAVACAAQAQPSAPPESIQIKASGAAAYRLAPREFEQFARAYLLDNGIVIHLYQRRQRFYTQLYNEAPVELYAQAPGKFSTANGARLEFTDDGDTIAITRLDRMPYSGLTPIVPDRVYMASR